MGPNVLLYGVVVLLSEVFGGVLRYQANRAESGDDPTHGKFDFVFNHAQ